MDEAANSSSLLDSPLEHLALGKDSPFWRLVRERMEREYRRLGAELDQAALNPSPRSVELASRRAAIAWCANLPDLIAAETKAAAEKPLDEPVRPESDDGY